MEIKYMERDNLMHGARTALNRDQEIRVWAENYLKEKTRMEMPEKSEEEFETYWKYHKPEIMHAGAAEAMAAFREAKRVND
jgi:arginyl-tRNA--protein-N-Asp/Glu arginylyltransferase